MAEIIYRFPSKVPYGYVEVRFEGQYEGPARLAETYIEDFKKFKAAEERALQAPVIIKPKPEPTVEEVLSEDEVKDLLVKELGAVPVDETGDEPWNNKPEPAAKEWKAPSDDAWDFG